MDVLKALKSGDHIAFEEVYETYSKKIFRFYLKRVSIHDTAKDLTQQCFIRLWNSRHTLSMAHSIDKQIFIIAYHTFLNHLKKAGKEAGFKKTFIGENDKEQATQEQSISFEQKDRISEAINTLPPVKKKILELKLLEGYSNKEIARILSISSKTVENHVTKAVHKLKERFPQSLTILLLYILTR
ncbi:MAG TPA: RNA polymerase sigma factor [Puia sp.]|jgi:RNA polymerase sigma-70 factor (ECF subfamily)